MREHRRVKFSADDLSRVQTRRLYAETSSGVYFKGLEDLNVEQIQQWLEDLKKYKDVKISELLPAQKIGRAHV